MKTITIQKLTLRNFKGCASLELELGGKSASIYGDNATGKTTIYDGLCWLLFGKDSLGQSNDELIKPLDQDGKVRDHDAVSSVEAVLAVDDGSEPCDATSSGPAGQLPLKGKALTLRKELRELWTTRRGSSQPIYSGNTVDYYVDGVPVQKKGYAARIEALVDEATFRALTSASYFPAELHWQKRRAVLADMSGAGNLSDNALLQAAVRELGEQAGQAGSAAEAEGLSGRAERFAALTDELEGGRSLDDEKKVLTQKQRDLKQAKDTTPARIDELQRQADRLAALDFDGAEARLDAVRQELGGLRANIAREEAESAEGGQIARATDKAATPTAAELGLQALEAKKAQYDAEWLRQRQDIADRETALNRENAAWAAEHRNEIRATERAIRNLEEENRAYRQKQADALPDLDTLQKNSDRLAERVQEYLAAANEKDAEALRWDGLVNDGRREWIAANKESFEGGSCPTCGQELPMQMLAEAKARFDAQKAAKLKDIEGRARINGDNAEAARKSARESREKADLTQKSLDKALEDLEAAKRLPREIQDLDVYQEDLAALKAKLEVLEAQTDMPLYQNDLFSIRALLKAHEDTKEMPGYAEAKAALEAALAKEQAEAAREADEKAGSAAKLREQATALRTREKDLTAQEKQLTEFLGQRVTLDYSNKRIDELKADQQKAFAELEQTEALLYSIEDFIRWKMRYVEDSVNGLFRLVTFRLFLEQANGGVAERCDVMVGGVPYAALNNGARINAGLDIIRRLSEHYGVRVPLFVDNAEGVTRLEDAGTQVIRLVVSEQDKRLRVEI